MLKVVYLGNFVFFGNYGNVWFSAICGCSEHFPLQCQIPIKCVGETKFLKRRYSCFQFYGLSLSNMKTFNCIELTTHCTKYLLLLLSFFSSIVRYKRSSCCAYHNSGTNNNNNLIDPSFVDPSFIKNRMDLHLEFYGT